MFKRSLASVAAVAVVSGAVVAPANAINVTVNDDMCTFNLTDEEAGLLRLQQTVIHKTKAANIKTSIVEPQLPTLRAQIKEAEKKLDNLEPGAAGREKLKSELKEKKKKLTAYINFRDALVACIAGQNYDSGNPGGPKNPDDSGNPEVERALPSTNGAVIGAIVAVLGILAAALPVIKSILRALLP